MGRNLDAATAEALGKKVIWLEIIDSYRLIDNDIDNTEAEMIKVPVIEMEKGKIHYTAYCDGVFYVGTNLVPKYSSDGNDVLELEKEMRTKGWHIEHIGTDAESNTWVCECMRTETKYGYILSIRDTLSYVLLAVAAEGRGMMCQSKMNIRLSRFQRGRLMIGC